MPHNKSGTRINLKHTHTLARTVHRFVWLVEQMGNRILAIAQLENIILKSEDTENVFGQKETEVLFFIKQKCCEMFISLGCLVCSKAKRNKLRKCKREISFVQANTKHILLIKIAFAFWQAGRQADTDRQRCRSSCCSSCCCWLSTGCGCDCGDGDA